MFLSNYSSATSISVDSSLFAGPVPVRPDAAAAADVCPDAAAAAGHGSHVPGAQLVSAAAAAAAASDCFHRRPAVPGRQYPGQPGAADAAVPVIGFLIKWRIRGNRQRQNL